MMQRVLIWLFVIMVPKSVTKERRELPISNNCDPRIGSCVKGDLIAISAADCKRKTSSIYKTCDPVGRYPFSNVVDVPDTQNGVNCVPVISKPIWCGLEYDTRCVCDKAVDYKKPKETLFHQCRCQYWPELDDRMNQPSYCTQYDHGGVSGVHFYTCCNNCNDADSSCAGTTYHGGGSKGYNYCGECGINSNEGGGRITYRFNCVDCEQQRECEATCDEELLLDASAKFPGLCPLWSGCFRGCCIKAAKLHGFVRQSEDVPLGFCGDLICQDDENEVSCPIDCCPLVSPLCNTTECPINPCCLHYSCCLNTTNTVTDDDYDTDDDDDADGGHHHGTANALEPVLSFLVAIIACWAIVMSLLFC